ncbi:TATA-box-binding protein [Promethearchaeum syntrophicum]|uniref:TATA-box-binding protein n=1 Tax=Promethearchaeum syntrophicum TaxID=2594042 RepID=A0A5B9DAT4_9ARCH|nr:TATA-box-binding protein [Candidatus Prometheoarchaeum syntrophicum]
MGKTSIQDQKTSSISKKNKVSLRIENVVASINLGIELSLEKILEKYKDIEKKNNFPGLVAKINIPKATILIFASGKLVCTGVRLPRDIPIVVSKIVGRIEKAGIKIEEEPIVKIENIVVRGDFHQSINLDITSLILDSAIYEPEVFPGLIYKIADPKICFLIFSSGRIIVTGSNNEDIIKKSVKKLAITLKDNGVLGENGMKEEKDLDILDL